MTQKGLFFFSVMMLMCIWFDTVLLFNNFRSLPILLILAKVQLASFTAMHQRACLHLTVRVLIPSVVPSFYFRNCIGWSNLYHLGRAIAQAVSRWLPNAAVRGSKPDLIMWDLWWDKVALG
jgi:hypothetical protein